MTRRPPRPKHALRLLGLAAAVLALVGRLASGMVAVDPQALGEVSALLAAAVPCGTQDDAGDGHRRLPADPGQGLVVLASFLFQPSPVLLPAVFPPPPRQGVVAVAVVLPPARGPPSRHPGAALPRGPPVLL